MAGTWSDRPRTPCTDTARSGLVASQRARVSRRSIISAGTPRRTIERTPLASYPSVREHGEGRRVVGEGAGQGDLGAERLEGEREDGGAHLPAMRPALRRGGQPRSGAHHAQRREGRGHQRLEPDRLVVDEDGERQLPFVGGERRPARPPVLDRVALDAPRVRRRSTGTRTAWSRGRGCPRRWPRGARGSPRRAVDAGEGAGWRSRDRTAATRRCPSPDDAGRVVVRRTVWPAPTRRPRRASLWAVTPPAVEDACIDVIYPRGSG